MNQNFQTSSNQLNPTPQDYSQSNHTQNSNIALNPHISPLSHVSILKTEEQKEIVRTNIFEPNNPNSNNPEHFTVVTEVIRRKSNIPLDVKPNTSNKIDINFSFNRPIIESTLNQNIQNRNVNINIDEDKRKKEQNYKLLIKKIAMQLKNKIRPPTHGFFYFAFQKGQYPLFIIKKFEDKIINHSIQLNSDIFNVYFEKYLKYRQLVKKIALLLKANMQHMFWENDRYKNQSIQVKVTNKNINNNSNVNTEITTNIKTKNNVQGHSNVAVKKNVSTNKNNMQNNKKIINVKTNQVNTNTSQTGNNLANNAKKIKSHNLKSTNASSNNNRNNMNNQNSSQYNLASHKLNNVINPFAATAKAQNQIQKKLNFNKKVEPPSNKNNSNLFNNKQFKGRNGVTNVEKNEINKSASSETNKNGKIKFNNHFGKLQNNNKEMSINNSVNDNIKITSNMSDRTQVITLGKKNANNNITTTITNNNLNNVQNSIDSNNDVEMKDEINNNNNTTAFNMNQEINNNNINNQQPKKSLNMKLIPSNSIIETNTIMNNVQTNNNSTVQNDTSNNNNNESMIRINNIKRMTFDSIKSPGKKLTIKLSAFKKTEDIPKTNITKAPDTNPYIPIKISQTKIDINSIEIPSDNSKITDEHISFVNKFNVLLSNNGLVMEYNIPMAENDEGKYYLKKNEFWEKFVNYVYIKYLIDKKNKLSMFSFLHLIEQYFLWCEFISPENAKNFKKLLIDVMSKVFTQKEIKQFLSMNKMNNLEELFSKYEVFMKYGNKNNYMKNNEIQIKIDNGEECNCELCQNEKACIKKISEMNKSINIDVNVESIMIEAQNPPEIKKKENDTEKYQTNNYYISFKGKNKSGLFSKSKTLHSFESVFQYVPPRLDIQEENKEEEKEEIKEKEVKEEQIKSASNKKKSKSKSESKSKSKSKSRSKSKNKKEKKDKENFIDVINNAKIDEYLTKEENDKEEKENEEDKEEKEEKEKSENRKQSRKKNAKKNNNNKKNKRNSSKYSNNDVINYEMSSDEEEEKEKEKEKDKKKKKRKSKSRNKNYSIKYELESETESEEEDYIKNKKKSNQYPKRKKGKSKW